MNYHEVSLDRLTFPDSCVDKIRLNLGRFPRERWRKSRANQATGAANRSNAGWLWSHLDVISDPCDALQTLFIRSHTGSIFGAFLQCSLSNGPKGNQGESLPGEIQDLMRTGKHRNSENMRKQRVKLSETSGCFSHGSGRMTSADQRLVFLKYCLHLADACFHNTATTKKCGFCICF